MGVLAKKPHCILCALHTAAELSGPGHIAADGDAEDKACVLINPLMTTSRFVSLHYDFVVCH